LADRLNGQLDTLVEVELLVCEEPPLEAFDDVEL
jgi:hypothetical protein